MRDPNRLDNFYEQMKQIHKENFPDWRFGQFLMNFLCWYGHDIFYIEEGRFIEKLNEYIASFKN